MPAATPKEPAPQRELGLEDLRYIQQMYQSQFMLINQEINTRLEVLRQLENVQRTLENINTLENKRTLIPVGSDAYLEGKVTNSTSVVVGIGAGYLAEKKTDEAKSYVAKAIERETGNVNRLVKNKKELENALIEVSYKIDELSRSR